MTEWIGKDAKGIIKKDHKMSRRRFLAFSAAVLGAAGVWLLPDYLKDTDIEKEMQKVEERYFPAASKFNKYKGEWEQYTIQPEDRNMYNVALRCAKKLGANGEHWRNEIMDYAGNKNVDWKRHGSGTTIWVPKDCDCQSPYRVK